MLSRPLLSVAGLILLTGVCQSKLDFLMCGRQIRKIRAELYLARNMIGFPVFRTV